MQNAHMPLPLPLLLPLLQLQHACVYVYIDMFIAIRSLAGSGSQVYICKADEKQREGGKEEG